MVEFIPGYFVNRNGEIFSNQSGDMKKINGCVRNGYRVVGFKNGKKHQTRLIHRIVAESFIPNPEQKPIVNHKDGNKLNNRVENLEWVTFSENTQHAWDTGLIKKDSSKKSENGLMEQYRKKAINMLHDEIEERAMLLRFLSTINESQKLELAFLLETINTAKNSGISNETIIDNFGFAFSCILSESNK